MSRISATMPGAMAPFSPAPLALIAVTTLWLALSAGDARGQAAPSSAPRVPIGCPDGWKPVPPGVNPALRCLPAHLAVAPQRTPAVPPPGCPAGWQPVPPEVNPVLRCQPVRLASGTPSRAAPQPPPPGCPEGWRPVPQGVNPLLRCLPNEIAATPPPRGTAGIAPGACPKGWKKAPPGTNPLMRCVPGSIASPLDPPQDGPGTGDPGQGRDVSQLVALPDLALIASLRLGDVDIPWGQSATMSSDAASEKRKGRCLFRYAHRTRNQGAAASGAATNRIHLGAANGAVLAQAALPALAPGAVQASSGHVLLAPGTTLLYVHADGALAVPEGNEANNLRRVRVTVEGRCG